MTSHWHWDHIGDVSLFPRSTEVVVGPGFKDNFMPGYPVNDKAPLLQSDFE
jgi:glyoxylase-like metal-dependent hydrolase (beta-lactamase superfamily II)